jgi:hypothetical protein
LSRLIHAQISGFWKAARAMIGSTCTACVYDTPALNMPGRFPCRLRADLDREEKAKKSLGTQAAKAKDELEKIQEQLTPIFMVCRRPCAQYRVTC